jgi:hypothetical protein
MKKMLLRHFAYKIEDILAFKRVHHEEKIKNNWAFVIPNQ